MIRARTPCRPDQEASRQQGIDGGGVRSAEGAGGKRRGETKALVFAESPYRPLHELARSLYCFCSVLFKGLCGLLF